ncbi:Band 7 protein [Portunus trituberculatus]|uniref:Band 7 protein n=1 Tax=Portunus trituberculatus TaxID=210409 RepID=A0A5B7DGL8_PORTR|nr:Band 7 protein [Portunus trituberculatus]
MTCAGLLGLCRSQQQAPSIALRYMQTLNAISAEKNSTIIFPLPIDLLSQYMKNGNSKNGKNVKSKKDLLSDDE